MLNAPCSANLTTLIQKYGAYAGETGQIVTDINTAIQSAMGYFVSGYFLFSREEDAAQLLDHHVCNHFG